MNKTLTVEVEVEQTKLRKAPDRSEAYRFVLMKRVPMPHGRKSTARKPGFVDGYMTLLTDFYENVVQSVTPWQAPAPKRRPVETLEPEPEPEPTAEGSWV